MSDPGPFTIGEVARRTGLSVHALRFYEREDLLAAEVARTAGGRRLYSAQDLEWLDVCVKLRETGMPLADLKDLAALVRRGPSNEEERLAILERHRARVAAQMHALEEAQAIIAWKTDVYGAHVRDRTAVGLWDPTAAEGSGPETRRVAGDES